MIAKYIRCEVVEAKRNIFSKGQRLWLETAHCEGFISQLGGWEQETNIAVILARWTDMESVKDFMSAAHDPIAERANQVGSYSHISVSYLSAVICIPAFNQGGKNQASCGFIRIADCYIDPDKLDEFIQEQKTLWNPGMQQVEGMLGGQLWQFNDESDRYLVTTYWESEAAHRHYMAEYFPRLKQQAATDIIHTISGHHIQTEPSWRVTP
ncbi:DUF4937 domain-containing protein [Shewanella woodyi]|uniref:Antibiotic biosynthesis monooxygenase n=1 Tax=Shewanella woodyi (strain ATCC 51908 / MS32) TaxID=392500 RepID=B1KN34_SHEWM|nr:DUF4937 domain-containing protein [Shewanella woodyi]ACA88991.1 Antibiotic biosynthesis monooxygenase [Shewanella woodyi ATCC 51908]